MGRVNLPLMDGSAAAVFLSHIVAVESMKGDALRSIVLTTTFVYDVHLSPGTVLDLIDKARDNELRRTFLFSEHSDN